ncbi:MAG: hypothetical protein AVO34_06895 [Firmicutes bacterium ML8_F2]|nr:MAG: hypothetical protein AVO34_06895 [Firmicutes bacterium ML8_F2]
MKISLTSNVANRIKKIREGVVYQEWLCFVSELFQNAQRAKAKNIDIEVDEGYFAIYDDGKGCVSPKHVFTLDFSHWETNVHSPFGEGFSSLFVIADRIKIQSRNWQAFFDLKEALEQEDFDSIQVSEIPFVKGFCVELAFAPRYSIESIQKEVTKIASMISQNVHLNGKLIDKRSISYNPFTVRKKLKGFGEIIAAPAERYGNIEILYEGRPIRESLFDGIKGILSLRPGAITLRAPDRRDIIYDDKRTALERRLQALAQEMLLKVIKHYPREIDRFKSSIENLLHPSQYAKHLHYGLRKSPAEKKPVSKPVCVAELGREEEFTTTPSGGQTSTIPATSRGIPMEPNEEIKEIKQKAKKNSIFYRLHRETDLEDLQAKIEYLGLMVLVVDELQGKALEWMGVPHIRDADQVIEERHKCTRVGAVSRKEEKLLELLAPIAAHYGYAANLFSFADIETLVLTKVNSKTVKKEKISPTGVCIKNNNAGCIYLSRRGLKIRQLNISYSGGMNAVKNIKALTAILPTVAHELAHLLYNAQDNTLEIYKTQERILKEIFSLIRN